MLDKGSKTTAAQKITPDAKNIVEEILKAMNIIVCGVRSPSLQRGLALEIWSKAEIPKLLFVLLQQHVAMMSTELVVQATCCLSNLLALEDNLPLFIENGEGFLQCFHLLLKDYPDQHSVVKFVARCITNISTDSSKVEHLEWNQILESFCYTLRIDSNEEEEVEHILAAIANLSVMPSMQVAIMVEVFTKTEGTGASATTILQDVAALHKKDSKAMTSLLKILANVVTHETVLDFLATTKKGEARLHWIMKEWRDVWVKKKHIPANVVFSLF